MLAIIIGGGAVFQRRSVTSIFGYAGRIGNDPVGRESEPGVRNAETNRYCLQHLSIGALHLAVDDVSEAVRRDAAL